MSDKSNENDDFFGPFIYAYTREQAIEDGVLVDVCYISRQVGLKFHTAVTTAVWEQYVKVPTEVEWQDESGRLWDILWMLRMAIQRQRKDADTILYKLLVQNTEAPAEEITLKCVCGPGDKGEPVLTIMLPGED